MHAFHVNTYITHMRTSEPRFISGMWRNEPANVNKTKYACQDSAHQRRAPSRDPSPMTWSIARGATGPRFLPHPKSQPAAYGCVGAHTHAYMYVHTHKIIPAL